MRPRENQLIVEILLLIVITGIVIFTCLNLAQLVNVFSDAVGKAISGFNIGL